MPCLGSKRADAPRDIPIAWFFNFDDLGAQAG
jgi:hypothetical protein